MQDNDRAAPPQEFRATVQVAPKHYEFLHYAPKGRWVSYWYQVVEVLGLHARTCLVVGVGDDIVTDVLRREIDQCESIDIDPNLHPTIVGSVTSMPLPPKSVDVVLCSQVLEHLPFDQFEPAIQEMSRVARLGIVLSLPQLSRAWSIRVGPVRRRDRQFWVSLPFNRTLPPNDQHYWEVDAKGYPVKRVRKVLRRYGQITKDYRVPEHPYHHFWVLSFSPSD